MLAESHIVEMPLIDCRAMHTIGLHSLRHCDLKSANDFWESVMTNGGGTGHHEQTPKKSAKKAKGSSKSKNSRNVSSTRPAGQVTLIARC